MPGSVHNASSVGVLPFSLCRQLVETRQFPVRLNEYHDGTSQRQALAATSRRTWKMGKRLTATQLGTLRTFLFAHPTDAFYIYSMKETNPAFSWDATGVSTPGRYLVRLGGNYSQTVGLGRLDTELELIETA